jgi:hypothetical protein
MGGLKDSLRDWELTVPVSIAQGKRVLHSQQVRDDGTTKHRGKPLEFDSPRGPALVGISTYLIFPDDVVWHFIKTSQHARIWEHALFGTAAALLGFALLLKVKAGAHPENQDSHGPSRTTATVASLLQAIGIGSLLPLPGFFLLVVGDGALSLLLYGQKFDCGRSQS